jgi:signal-transduction protein with cAMP-binding, CBS, and nucleotidyltransferase domain
VITDRDITVRAVARGFDPEQTTVEETMTDVIVVLPEDSELEDASELMEDKHVRRLVVTDENDIPVGVISMDRIAAVLGHYGLHGETNRRSGLHPDDDGGFPPEDDFEPGALARGDGDG